MDDTHVRKINRSLVYGWMAIVVILFVSYVLEVVKGMRSVTYLLTFMAFTAVPALIVLVLYLTKPGRYSLRYSIIIGYFFMYIFVMVTGSTTMVFSYILPMLSLLVLFHQPMMIVVTGIAALFVNLISVYLRYVDGSITKANSKDIEIQIALLVLCFTGSFLATRLYDNIHRKNEAFNKEITERNRQIERMTVQTITTIANTIDAKDEYTRGHSRRVAEYSATIANMLGMSDIEVRNIRIIGLLHDIGKIGIPDSVLNKPGKLTSEEYQVMKGHTTAGSDILKDIDMIPDLDIGARYHHERPDGKGYPDGLSGEEIPMIARIIAVADAYDAMSSNRVYRKHLPKDAILLELQKGRGSQWDANITDIMIRLIEEDLLPKINPDEEEEVVQQASTILTRVIDMAEDKGGETNEDLDSLTGTYGRDKGRDMIQASITTNGTGVVMVFDIDNFHFINETEGFAVGDIYLKKAVGMIRKLSKDMIVSRFGADVFVAYLPTIDSIEKAEALARDFIEQTHMVNSDDKNLHPFTVSIGITEVATEKDKVMVLYENANKALYVAKQQGGNIYYSHQAVDHFVHGKKDPAADLNTLVNIIQNRHHYKGGLIAAYPEFGKMYEFISSLAERNEMQVHIVLFTIASVKDKKTDLSEQTRVMELMQKAIVGSIRNVDVTTRYSSTQIAMLLMNLDDTSVKGVINRIMTEFLRTYDKNEFTIHYDTADLSKGVENKENK